MTAPDHATNHSKNTLRERGHPYMSFDPAHLDGDGRYNPKTPVGILAGPLTDVDATRLRPDRLTRRRHAPAAKNQRRARDPLPKLPKHEAAPRPAGCAIGGTTG